jgi:ABC-type transport system involved in cytochrome c biogenesis permease subunit
LVIRIAINVLRIAVLINLILGIIFWTGNADNLKILHIVIGIIAVLALWTLGIAQGVRRGGSFGIALATFVVGFLAALVGLFQTRWLPEPNPNHWIIQVIHLLLGLAMIGLGEMINGRSRRLAAKAAA